MYVIGLGLVLDNLDQIQNIIAYAVGFAIGVIVGSRIEEKLALGYITVNVISSNPDIEFTRKLRDKGYGVTSWLDRKSTRLNSSHVAISYAVFCLKKKKKTT